MNFLDRVLMYKSMTYTVSAKGTVEKKFMAQPEVKDDIITMYTLYEIEEVHNKSKVQGTKTLHYVKDFNSLNEVEAYLKELAEGSK